MKHLYLLVTFIILSSTVCFAQTIKPAKSADTLKNNASSNTSVRFFSGLNINNFSSTISGSGTSLSNSKPSKSTTPGFNIGVDIPLDENNTWLLRTEANYESVKDNFNYLYTSGSVTQTNDALSFKESIINIIPEVILNVVKMNDLNVYLSSGIAINIRNYSSKKYTETTTYTVSGTTGTSNMQIPDLKSLTFYIPAKIGILVINSIDIYAAYNAKTSLNNNNQFSINETSFTAGINYIFGRR